MTVESDTGPAARGGDSWAIFEEAMMMLGDVPGETLLERLSRLQGWYLEMQIELGNVKHRLEVAEAVNRLAAPAQSLATAAQAGGVEDRGAIPERETWWLIERPGPIYVTSEGWHPGWSTDPWRAKRYPTARAADGARLSIRVDHLRNDSSVVEHMFINKMPRALSHSPQPANPETSQEGNRR